MWEAFIIIPSLKDFIILILCLVIFIFILVLVWYNIWVKETRKTVKYIREENRSRNI